MAMRGGGKWADGFPLPAKMPAPSGPPIESAAVDALGSRDGQGLGERREGERGDPRKTDRSPLVPLMRPWRPKAHAPTLPKRS